MLIKDGKCLVQITNNQGNKIVLYTCTFPKLHMMFYAPGDSGDNTGGFYLQKALIHFLYTIPTIPPLPAVFWLEP